MARSRSSFPSSRPRSWSKSSSYYSTSTYCFVLLLVAFPTLVFLFFSPSHTQTDTADRRNSLFPEVTDDKLWESLGFGYRPCTMPSSKYRAPDVSDRYMTVKSNGGLNQMRTGISDMVAIARIMNATLVIPQLDKKSFWQDSSIFSDVFDEPYFIKALEGDVRIVKELPKEIEVLPRARKHFSSWASFGYYQEMTRLFETYKVIHVPKSDSRLANNDLPADIQRLRCRALYHALHYSAPIEDLGKGSSLSYHAS